MRPGTDSLLTTPPASRRLDELRAEEYGYLDAESHVYLDYTGAGLPARAQLREHAARIQRGCYGNPHSENPASRASTVLVEQARQAVLRHFNASPDEYAVIFTANASAACRLVGEAYPYRAGDRLLLTADSHNSVNGLREFARARGAETGYVRLRTPAMRIDEADLRAALRTGGGLLAYPAQSNFSGVRHPLSWIDLAHDHGFDVLLDAAAFVPTNELDLARVKPDFVPVSWYKVFGYPTGVGCLLARHRALARLRRPWFAGGTVQVASALGGWHRHAGDHTAYEDGTLNFQSIPDVAFGIDWIRAIGVGTVHRHVTALTGRLLERLTAARHRDGSPLVRLYGPATAHRRGATVAFNLLDPRGALVDERLVARETAAAGISVRTGCFCNPGAAEAAYALTDEQLRSARHHPPHTLDEYLHALNLKTAGAIRASLGIASNTKDIDHFTDFIQTHYTDRTPPLQALPPRTRC